MTINHLCVDEMEIAYTDEGAGHPIVFVHGVCIVPTWPFGAHEVPTRRKRISVCSRRGAVSGNSLRRSISRT